MIITRTTRHRIVSRVHKDREYITVVEAASADGFTKSPLTFHLCINSIRWLHDLSQDV